MRTETITRTLYKFDELSAGAQETAIEGFADINVDYDWWELEYDYFKEKLGVMGIECDSFFFDLDRANYIYMDNPVVVDVWRLLLYGGIDRRTKAARDMVRHGVCIGTTHHGGGQAHNWVDYDTQDCKLANALNGMLKTFLSDLRKQCDFLLSDEAIRETIECNEYEFDKDGNLK